MQNMFRTRLAEVATNLQELNLLLVSFSENKCLDWSPREAKQLKRTAVQFYVHSTAGYICASSFPVMQVFQESTLGATARPETTHTNFAHFEVSRYVNRDTLLLLRHTQKTRMMRVLLTL